MAPDGKQGGLQMQEAQDQSVAPSRRSVVVIALAVFLAFAAGFLIGQAVGPFRAPADPIEAGK